MFWANAYAKTNLMLPWKFYNERCYRTISAIFGANVPNEKPTDAHDPLVDCKFQIDRLIKIMATIKT